MSVTPPPRRLQRTGTSPPPPPARRVSNAVPPPPPLPIAPPLNAIVVAREHDVFGMRELDRLDLAERRRIAREHLQIVNDYAGRPYMLRGVVEDPTGEVPVYTALPPMPAVPPPQPCTMRSYKCGVKQLARMVQPELEDIIKQFVAPCPGCAVNRQRARARAQA